MSGLEKKYKLFNNLIVKKTIILQTKITDVSNWKLLDFSFNNFSWYINSQFSCRIMNYYNYWLASKWLKIIYLFINCCKSWKSKK